ncbi:hypothetical protein [Bacillus rhizoplanae]|uniref:hypothetical protein n=1 Tax=Bacillus rhizoplanae TaxID=2880966 RepID=UPI003D1DDCFD
MSEEFKNETNDHEQVEANEEMKKELKQELKEQLMAELHHGTCKSKKKWKMIGCACATLVVGFGLGFATSHVEEHHEGSHHGKHEEWNEHNKHFNKGKHEGGKEHKEKNDVRKGQGTDMKPNKPEEQPKQHEQDAKQPTDAQR